MTILIILVAPQAGRLSDRLGSRWLVAIGMLLLTASLLIFSTLDVGSSFWNILPGLLVGGFGMALTMTPVTAAAMSSVPVAKAGVGSAVINSMRQVGGSLGIAVMGAIVIAGTKSGLAAGDPRPVAFTNGLHHGLEVSAIIVLIGAGVAFSTLHHVRAHEEPKHSELPEPA
jgi:MFS family permease